MDPSGVQPPQPPQFNPAQYQFNSEELRALKECNVESFYQRSLPIGTALGVAAWAAVKRGMIKGSPKYGPVPKVALGVVAGYFIGKFSYQQKCAEKIMRLPNSPLGEMLRKRRQGGGGFADGFSVNPAAPGFGMQQQQPQPMQPYGDPGFNRPSSSLDMDTTRPSMSGLDDTYRGNVDAPITNFDDNLPAEPPKHSTSYDELRRANREEYQRRMNQPAARPYQQQQPQPPPQYSPPQSSVPEGYHQGPLDEPVTRPTQRNKYGDVWT